MIKSYKLFLESRSDIESICKEYNIHNWTLNEDGSIDVDGDVYLGERSLTKLPLKFRNVSGYFYCANNQLTSLEGAPQSVGVDFCCYNNQLTSLEGAPQSVGGHFDCNYNLLTSLEGGPQSVGLSFYCHDNQLTSLEGCPISINYDFYCNNNKLVTLEGGPQSVGLSFYCHDNQLTSLEGCPDHFKIIGLSGNPISEFFNLFKKNAYDSDELRATKTQNIVRYLNEYDVIQDDIIVMDRLKAVVDTLGVKFNFDGLNHLKNYRVEE